MHYNFAYSHKLFSQGLLSTGSHALSVTAAVSLNTWGPVGPDPAVLVLER